MPSLNHEQLGCLSCTSNEQLARSVARRFREFMDALHRLGRVQTLLEFCREAGVPDVDADAPDTTSESTGSAEASADAGASHSSASSRGASRASIAKKAAAAAAATAFAAFLSNTVVVWPHSAPPAPRVLPHAAPQPQTSDQAQLIERVLEALFANKTDPSHVLAFGYTRKVV